MNTKNYFKKIWKHMLATVGILVLVFGFIDYLIKWKIISFIFSITLILWNFLLQNFFEILVLLWLFVTTLILATFLRKHEKYDKRLDEVKGELLKNIKNKIITNNKALTVKPTKINEAVLINNLIYKTNDTTQAFCPACFEKNGEFKRMKRDFNKDWQEYYYSCFMCDYETKVSFEKEENQDIKDIPF